MTNKNNKLLDSREEGFTLVELLVVIVIIGVLAAVAIPIFSSQQRRSIQAGMKSDVRTVNTAMQTYLVKNPQATGLGFIKQGDGPITGTLASEPLFRNLTTSHPDTNLKLRGLSSNDTNGGAWDGYAILAYIDTLDTNRWTYSYNSVTGKFTESPG